MFDVFLSQFSSWISNITPGSKAFLCSKCCCFIWATLRITGKLHQLASTPYFGTMLVSTTPPIPLSVKIRDAHRLIMIELCSYRANTALCSFTCVVETMIVNKECILQQLMQTEQGLFFQLVSNYHKILHERSLSLLGTWTLQVSICLLYPL